MDNMDTKTLETIKQTQEGYFNKVVRTDDFGNEVKNNQYNQ